MVLPGVVLVIIQLSHLLPLPIGLLLMFYLLFEYLLFPVCHCCSSSSVHCWSDVVSDYIMARPYSSWSNWCSIGLIPAILILRSSNNSLYPCTSDGIFLFFIILIALIVFESKSYITSMYTSPCPDVVGNRPGKYVAIIPFNSSNVLLVCLLIK